MPAQLDKAVILARGLGKRMRESDPAATLSPEQESVAETGLKAMIPVGRPFIDYVLSGLADAGYKRACLIIGPEHGGIRYYFARRRPRRIAVEFAVQPHAIGTADALLAAVKFIAGEEFLVMNSDNYYPVEMLRTLREMGEPGAVMFFEKALIQNSNIPAERIRAYAYALVDGGGYLQELIEKPDETTLARLAGRALVSMNAWRFSANILHYCRNVAPSARGEYELPVAVRDAIHAGMRLRVLESDAGVLDLSRRADIAAVAAQLSQVQVSL